MRGNRTRWALAALAPAACAAPALAQADLERFERQMEQIRRDTLVRPAAAAPADRRAIVEYGAFLGFDYLTLDDRAADNHVLRQFDLTAFARVNFDGVHEVYVRGGGAYRDFNRGDSFDGRGDAPVDPDVEIAYYRFDLQRQRVARGADAGTDDNLVLKVGRDLAYWGNGLALATPLDGVVVDWTTGPFELELLAGVTPTRTADFDSSRPAFDHNTRRGFYGSKLSARVGAQQLYAYALVQRDYNREDFDRPAGAPTRFEYDSFYLGAGARGGVGDHVLYGVELVYEGGRGLSDSVELTPGGPVPVGQRRESISAAAADVRLDYLFADARRSRAAAELIIASGDTDRRQTTNTFGGNRPGTADHAFNAFGLLNTGLAFAPPASNLIAVRVGASTFPLALGEPWDRLQIGADLFCYAKCRADAPIAEPTRAGDRYLGFEPDLFLNWQVTSDVTLSVRYGVFFPASAILSSDDARQFLFVGVTYAF